MPYLTVGFPSVAETLDLAPAIADAGADLIELGVPFSDPIADGPIIQASSQVALENGMSYDGVLAAVWTRGVRLIGARCIVVRGVAIGDPFANVPGEVMEAARRGGALDRNRAGSAHNSDTRAGLDGLV